MSHHHRKYYERPDGYVYSNEELDAYHIPRNRRDRCVNYFVPYLKCSQIKTDNLFKTLWSAADQTLDHWGGECHKEKKEYIQCSKTTYQLALGLPVQNLYYANPLLAEKEGVSAEYSKNHLVSPIVY